MTQRLIGKVAVVTGASKGIGAAIAKSLAAEGASIVINYASNHTDAESVVAFIASAGGNAIAVQGDVSNASDSQRIINAAIVEYGRLDILVNNAGVYEFFPLEEITESHFRKVFDTNVLGLLLMTQAAAKEIGEGGSIINIGASITTMKPPGSSVYAASKSSVETITGILAKELGKKKIRVNSISPGPTKTEGSARMQGKGDGLIAQTPLGRLGTPEDIASVVVFIASEDARWITGDTILASGGLQ